MPVEPPPEVPPSPANTASQANQATANPFSTITPNFGMGFNTSMMMNPGLNQTMPPTGVPPPQIHMTAPPPQIPGKDLSYNTMQNMYNYPIGYGYDQTQAATTAAAATATTTSSQIPTAYPQPGLLGHVRIFCYINSLFNILAS